MDKKIEMRFSKDFFLYKNETFYSKANPSP